MAEINKEQNVKKFLKIALIGIAVFILAVALILGFTGQFNSRVDAIASVADKNCQFIVLGDSSRAICSDGTQYKVELIATPLP